MKSDYALRAVVELAAAYGGPPLQTGEIAARRSIPESFLEQLLPVLRKAGLVASVRGPQGGHSLAAPPAEVTVGDVVRALEGSILAVDCGASTNPCPAEGDCVLHEMWQEVRAAVDAVMERTTIAELAARESARKGVTMYHI